MQLFHIIDIYIILDNITVFYDTNASVFHIARTKFNFRC